MYLVNRRPSMPLNFGILEETWTNEELNLNHLRTFGCISYVYIELSNRSTLNPKFKRCIFIRYGTDEYGYRFWDPENRKILRHKDMISMSIRRIKTCRRRGARGGTSEHSRTRGCYRFGVRRTWRCSHGLGLKHSWGKCGIPSSTSDPQDELRRSTRQTKAPERCSLSLHYLLLTDSGEPKCYEEALQVKVEAKCELAVDDEMVSLMENQIWDLVELSERKCALHNKWVYWLKEKNDGTKR